MRHVRPDRNPCPVPCQTSPRNDTPHGLSVRQLLVLTLMLPDQEVLSGLKCSSLYASRWSSVVRYRGALLPRPVAGLAAVFRQADAFQRAGQSAKRNGKSLVRLTTVSDGQ